MRKAVLAAGLAMVIVGCGGAAEKKKGNREFFTSGSREADQRASQTMAKAEQLSGSGEGSGEKEKEKRPKAEDAKGGTNKMAQAEGKLALFDRLGGEPGISKIIDDFIPRVLEDPRVNWQRKGLTSGGFLGMNKKSVTWADTPENVAQLKKHMVQFIALATGGPAQYDGKPIKGSHAGMRVGNTEFDAVIGDLKATLDRLQIPNKEQKELLAIFESTRPEIVTER